MALNKKVLFYDKGKIKPSDLVKLAEIFFGGGTSPSPTLQKALRIIEERKRYSRADIVFVTDGVLTIEQLLNVTVLRKEIYLKREIEKFNVVTVLIGKKVSEHYVKRFSDKIVRASDSTMIMLQMLSLQSKNLKEGCFVIRRISFFSYLGEKKLRGF